MADEHLLEDEAADQPVEDDDDPGSRSIGSIISWSSADQVGPIGILYVILALILVSGRVITDGKSSLCRFHYLHFLQRICVPISRNSGFLVAVK